MSTRKCKKCGYLGYVKPRWDKSMDMLRYYCPECNYNWSEPTRDNETNKPLKCKNHSTDPECANCGGSHFEFECT